MENFTMLQFFKWYYPTDGSLWRHFAAGAQRLKDSGIESVWLPLAHKGMEGNRSNRYYSFGIITLNRIVGQLAINIEDALPANER